MISLGTSKERNLSRLWDSCDITMKTKFVALFFVVVAGVGSLSAGSVKTILDANDFSYYRYSGKGETFVMQTASVTDDEVKRKSFWAKVENDKIPVIYQLVFKKLKGWKHKLPELDSAKSQIDAFFAPGTDFVPNPKKIYAVTLCEENVTWDGQLEVQASLAKYLKERYGVKTYHWLTEPLKPTLVLHADGWVFDAYCITKPEAFYSHVESFILTGLPVVPCIWGSGHFCRYHLDKSWDELVRFTLERMDICRALNLPVMSFAVGGKMGSVGLWFKDSEDAGEQFYRNVIREYLGAVPKMPKSSWKSPDKRWRLTASSDGAVKSHVDLKSFELVRETLFDDVRNWRLTEKGLELMGNEGCLVWKLDSVSKIKGGTIVLSHTPGAKGIFAGEPLSETGITRVKLGCFRSRTVALRCTSPVTLETVAFRGEGEYEQEAIGMEIDTEGGKTDFTAKYTFERGAGGALASVMGAVARKRIVQKVLVPGCGGKFSLSANVFAQNANGGSVKLSLSTNGETSIAEAITLPEKTGQRLELEYFHRDSLNEIYLIWDLVVSCGIKVPGFPASVKSWKLSLKPAHP